MTFDSYSTTARFLMFAYNVSNPQAAAPTYVFVFGCNTSHAPGFKAGNPNMDISFYVPIQRDDGAYGVNVPQSLTYWINNHPDWILYQSDKITPAYQFGSTAIPLDQSNSAVVAWQEGSYSVPADASGYYDAIAVDNVSLTNDWSSIGVYAGATPGSQFSGTWTQLYSGVNNQPLYATNIINWLNTFGTAIRAQTPAMKMVSNFDPGSYGFYAPQTTSVLAANDGLLAEFGFAHYGDGNRSGQTWLDIIAWMRTVQAQGKPIYIVNALPYPTQQSDIDFAFASYLMGRYHSAAIYITPQSSPGNPLYGTEHDYPHYHVNVGSPLTDMYEDQNVYVRKFANGLAIVNNDASNTYKYYFSGNYKDVNGNAVSSPLTLAPLTGVTLQGATVTNTPLPTNNPNLSPGMYVYIPNIGWAAVQGTQNSTDGNSVQSAMLAMAAAGANGTIAPQGNSDGLAATSILEQAIGLYSAGGQLLSTGLPNLHSFDRMASWLGKGQQTKSITASVAGDTQLNCASGVLKALAPGQKVKLGGSGSGPEWVTISTSYVPSANATAVPIQETVQYAGQTSATFDVFSNAGGGAGSILPDGIGLFMPVSLDAPSGNLYAKQSNGGVDIMNAQAAALGGTSDFHLVSAATNNATVIKASAGQVYGYEIYNANAAVRFVKLYNKTTTPAPATDSALLKRVIAIPPSSRASFHSSTGIAFATGIGIATVTGIADNDNTSVGASDLVIEIDWF